jgi:hypothetical protein
MRILIIHATESPLIMGSFKFLARAFGFLVFLRLLILVVVGCENKISRQMRLERRFFSHLKAMCLETS